VPKGVEPIYSSNDIPFIRNLASSDHATPEQVKELHKRYFEGQMGLPSDDETQNFLMQVLAQLSDFQIIWFDHQRRQANPDLEQMRYDSGATGDMLVNLSLKLTAQQFGLAEGLLLLGETLQDMKMHQFYMDGGASWEAFTEKGDEALKLAERLLVSISKNILIQPNQVKPIKEAIATHIRELVLVWSKKDQYFLRGDLYSLKEVFRRLAFNFNRFANMPSQNDALEFTAELKQIAQNLREASAGDFSVGGGFNPLDRIESKMGSTVQIAKEIYSKLEK
jgi:hypothetical protein